MRLRTAKKICRTPGDRRGRAYSRRQQEAAIGRMGRALQGRPFADQIAFRARLVADWTRDVEAIVERVRGVAS